MKPTSWFEMDRLPSRTSMRNLNSNKQTNQHGDEQHGEKIEEEIQRRWNGLAHGLVPCTLAGHEGPRLRSRNHASFQVRTKNVSVKFDRINLNQDAGKVRTRNKPNTRRWRTWPTTQTKTIEQTSWTPTTTPTINPGATTTKKTMQTNTDSEIFDRYTTDQDAGKVRIRNKPETRRTKTKQEKMMNMDDKQAWAESQNYQNFLKNVEKFGTSKRTWIHRGRPKKKPNGEKIELWEKPRSGDEKHVEWNICRKYENSIYELV